MKLIDLINIGLKNIKGNIIRTIMVCSLIGLSVFLILTYDAMQNAMIKVKDMKTESNIELRQIKIDGYKIFENEEGRVYGEEGIINLRDIQEISEIEQVQGVWPLNFFQRYTYPGLNIKKILIDGIQQEACHLMNLYDELDFFDIAKVNRERMIDSDFKKIVAGREFKRGTDDFEVIISEDRVPIPFNKTVYIDQQFYNGVINKKVTFVLEGERVEANIVGIYSNKIRPLNESKDTNFKNTYVTGHNYSTSDLPIFINEALAIELLHKSDIFINKENYIPREVIVTVNDISQVEEVTKIIEEKYNYYCRSNISEAKLRMESLFFYKRVLGILGGMLLLIVLVIIINTMFMVLRERVRYIGVLKSVGYKKRTILKVLSMESILIGFIGGILGVLMAYIGQGLIRIILKNLLQEIQLYKYLVFRVSAIKAILSLISSIILASLAGLVPAILGAKLEPLKALNK
ncbi:MAG: FtsX-like permease family protein [bacterium]